MVCLHKGLVLRPQVIRLHIMPIWLGGQHHCLQAVYIPHKQRQSDTSQSPQRNASRQCVLNRWCHPKCCQCDNSCASTTMGAVASRPAQVVCVCVCVATLAPVQQCVQLQVGSHSVCVAACLDQRSAHSGGHGRRVAAGHHSSHHRRVNDSNTGTCAVAAPNKMQVRPDPCRPGAACLGL
jgi:hypothetical protein